MTQTFDPFALQTIAYAFAGHIATVTLNRPDVRNALNRQAYRELEEVFRFIRGNGDIRCVVVTGADPAFCSGEDVKQMMTGPERAASQARLTSVHPEPTPAAMAVLECERPVIAAVNGAAVGWGMEFALFADIRIASERAAFGEIFIKRGLIADVGGLWRLPRIVGPEAAAELLFTGDVVKADEALRLGLVSRVVPHEQLMETAMGVARRIAVNPPLALRFMKEGLRRSATAELADMGSWISATLGRLFETEDHREGVASFLEKRAPNFKGR